MELGKVVWAKLANYPYWPGRVTQIAEVKDKAIKNQLGDPQPDQQLIWFFGSRNYSYVPTDQIVDYEEHYDAHSGNKKAKTQKSFQAAIKEAEQWKKGERNFEEPASEDDSKHNASDNDTPKKRNKDTPRKKKGDEGKKEKKKRESTEGEKEDRSHKKRKADTTEETETQVTKKAKMSQATPKKERNDTDMPSLVGNEATDDMDVERERKQSLAAATISKAVGMLARHPVSKYHKLEFITHGDGSAQAKAFFSDARPSSKYEVHAVLGASYFLIDITCYAALLHIMKEGESAITQDINVSVLAPIPQGSEVKIIAKVVREKSRAGLVYLDGEVWYNNKLMVTARVIKSLLDPDLPVRKEGPKDDKKEDKKDNNQTA